ncbi:MAG: VCBS repeat-containing protein [Deltaproteobacteria bacterium]|nr:VCBS repeat-containing protein [Deltaproteobacteria bacterium]
MRALAGLLLVACRTAQAPAPVAAPEGQALIVIGAAEPVRPHRHHLRRDVDGDGYDDAVLDDRRLYLGGPDGLRTDRAIALPPPAHPAPVITAAMIAGDVDGDGFADVLVGDPGCLDRMPMPPCGVGRVSLYRGSRAGLRLDAPAQVLFGTGVDRRFGYTATPLGDVDGDGRDDVAIVDGQLGVDDVVHVFLGTATGLAPTPIDLPGGIAIAAGDIDGDGTDDLAVINQQAALLYRGGAAGLDAARAAQIPLPPAMLFMVTGAGGDFDGDGFGDLALGVDVMDDAGQLLPNGVLILRGGRGGLAPRPALVLRGDALADGFGGALVAGDLDDDGRDDLVIESTCAIMNAARTGCERGRIDVHLGGEVTRAASAAPVRTTFTIGETLLGLGDIDGDHRADVAYGAFVFRGARGGFASTAPPSL